MLYCNCALPIQRYANTPHCVKAMRSVFILYLDVHVCGGLWFHERQ